MKHDAKTFTRRLLAAAAPALAFFFSSCSGGDSLGSAVPTVHTVGWEYNGPSAASGVQVATYWNSRGDTKRLGGGRYDSQAIGMFVTDGGDVYVAGYEKNSDNASQPKVWKNGNLLYNLSLDQEKREWSGIATGIFVRGNDVYVAGSAGGPALWKNNVRVPLGIGGGTAGGYYLPEVRDVFVSNAGDVYVSGREVWNEVDPQAGLLGYVDRATIWVNGTPRPLNDGRFQVGDYDRQQMNGIAFGMAMSGGTIYAVGWVSEKVGQNWYSAAKLWELAAGPGGSILSTKNIGSGTGASTSQTVYASGGNVYAAFSEFDSYSATAGRNAKYYVNGPRYTLPGGEYTGAFGISGHGGDVYVVGSERDAGRDFAVAKYWINGEPHTISSGNYPAVASRIVVK